MFHNYLKVALRNLRRHSSFSFINIFGLAASMSVCLLAILLIKDAHSFDLFHPESGQTYRLITDAIRKSGGEETYASSPHPVARALAEEFSYVENWVPVGRRLGGDFRGNEKVLPLTGLLTGGNFFELFGFQLEKGDPATALADPFSIILTKSTAERFFKNTDPIGQVLENEQLGNFKVTGVLADFPGKTHFQFDALAAFSTLAALEKGSNRMPWLDNWNNYYAGFNYVKLRDGIRPETAEAALAEIAKTAYSGLELETRDRGYRFRLQPLGDISPGPVMSSTMGRALPSFFLWFLSALALIVILSACFNYTNLTIARSLTRAREVGVRKVLGATRKQVFAQFISESVLTSLLALGLGFVFFQAVIPYFSKLSLFAANDISFELDIRLMGLFFGFSLLVGLVAGILPSVILSKYSPLSILQKLENTKVFRRVGFRKVLIVGQFTLSLIFILLMTIVWKQTNFSVAETFASDRADLINIRLQGQPFDRAEAIFGQMAGVEKISAVSHLMGTWEDSSVDIRTNSEAEKATVRDYTIDHRFLENMELELLAGENFPNNPSQQHELFAIVNENFLEKFQLGKPAEAIGQTVIMGDSTQLAVRGVVKDFLFKPLNYSIEPLLLRYNMGNISVINLLVKNNDMPATVANMERAWKKLESGRELQYEYYDETIEKTYADVYGLLGIVGFFGILGLVIATLGILGMAIFTVETRAKEVSIRKIIGATASDLIFLLSKGYIWLLFFAIIIAVPISLFLGNMLLQTFALSIPLNLNVILPGVGILTLLGIAAIGSQTVRAALANPVENLKEE